jgi:hypothetical protein
MAERNNGDSRTTRATMQRCCLCGGSDGRRVKIGLRHGPEQAARTLAAAAAFLILAGCKGAHGEASTHPGTASAAGSEMPMPMSSDRESAIASALNATQPRDAARVLASPVASAYLASPFSMLPPGSEVHIDWAKMHVTGSLATVPATVTGSQPGSWVLLLVWQQDEWAVYGTRKGTS